MKTIEKQTCQTLNCCMRLRNLHHSSSGSYTERAGRYQENLCPLQVPGEESLKTC